MSTTTDTNPDLDRVLREATRVFLERGFSATSMSDLVAATGMNRAGLYAAFGSKHQLYITALKRHREATEPELRAVTRQALDGPDELFRAPKVVGDLLAVVVRHSKQGSLNLRAAVELSDDPAAMRQVREGWDELERGVAAVLDRAIAGGELRTTADPAHLARLALVFIQGVYVVGNADSGQQLVTDATTGLVALFNALTVHAEPGSDALLGRSESKGTGAHSVTDPPEQYELNTAAVSQIPVSIFLGDGHDHQTIEAALTQYLTERGLEVFGHRPPIIGSWFREFLARVKKDTAHLNPGRLGAEVERKVRIEVFDKDQAAIDNLVATGMAALITSLQGEANACVRAGAILILKVNGRLYSTTLFQHQLAWLERNHSLLQDPEGPLKGLDALGTHEPPDAIDQSPNAA